MCLISFISIVCFIYFYSLWNTLNPYVKSIGICLFVIQMGSYMLTALINPGLPKQELSLRNCGSVQFKNFRVCGVCNIIMNIDAGTAHCEDCNVCIEGRLKFFSKLKKNIKFDLFVYN